ncbi:MAG: hypothetical protein BMS9Abin36_1242 [Gammaproteobacteria bacterium]|nr:MAG: hypothetical protein BMS9Abin36_1242 [Gammaproteobacteria bacterium]
MWAYKITTYGVNDIDLKMIKSMFAPSNTGKD